MPNDDNQQFNERDLVFRYSRERRLEHASEAVKQLNVDGRKYSFNLLRPLTATKSLTFLFVSIIVLVAIMYLVAFFFGSKDEIVFGGNTINVSAFTFEGKTYLTLDKKIKTKESFYTGTVDLAVSSNDNIDPPPKEMIIHTERIFFTLEDEEAFKMAIPFEAKQLLILIQSEKEIQRLNVITE
ncbi:MAG: hypothetical protein LBV20_05430 [Treponema sp.]|jgi:hypothetical protein|nr:hypothetical protein [Treponema sp.]